MTKAQSEILNEMEKGIKLTKYLPWLGKGLPQFSIGERPVSAKLFASLKNKGLIEVAENRRLVMGGTEITYRIAAR